MSDYFNDPETLAYTAQYEKDLKESRRRHATFLRQRDNPIRPENVEGGCGPGHRVSLNMASWRGKTIECENCGRTLAGWQEKFKGKHSKDGPFLDLKTGWVLTSTAEAPCKGRQEETDGS